MHKAFTLLLLTILFPLVSCASVGIMRETYTDPLVLPEETLCPSQEDLVWETAAEGIKVTEYEIRTEKIKWACVQVDLETAGLEIAATPDSSEDLGKRFILKKFSSQNNTLTAVNTVPFDLSGRTYIPVSVVKINKTIICPPAKEYAALCLNKSDSGIKAKILPSQNEEIDNWDYAFGGFYSILQDGEIIEFAKFKRSRTACGLSPDGKYLYFFAACGINCPTGRNGLNFEECAIILRSLGCNNAMEFDGGHSTGLTIMDKNLIRPNLQRKVPALLGFYFK